MSRKTDNLKQVIQDLESRYGKDDPDVKQLNVALSTLNAKEDTPRRHWKASHACNLSLHFADVDHRALNT